MNKRNNKKRSESETTTNSHNKRSVEQNYTNSKGSNSGKRPINDPKWYIPGEDVSIIGDISYNLMNGVTNPIFNFGTNTVGNIALTVNKNSYAMPGLRMPSVTVMKYMPMYKADSGNSGINYAARKLYALMRKANSGARNYEPADLAVYIATLESIYVRYAEIARILLIAQKFSLKNRDIPKTLIQACGVNYYDVLNNFNNYVAKLNILAQQINSLAVPALDIFKRRHVLASNVFLDDAERPTQIIVPVSDCYYNYNPTAFNSGGALIGSLGLMQYQATNGTPNVTALTQRSLYSVLYELQDQLDLLLSDDDTNIISGDIMKAFGESNLFTVQRVSSDAIIEFVYDELMLSQFMNSTSLDLPNGSCWMNDGSAVVPWNHNDMPMVFYTPNGKTMVPTTYQMNGSLVTKFTWNDGVGSTVSPIRAGGVFGLYGMSSYIIDAYHNNPNSDYTIEATRLLTGVDDNGAIYGTEIILGWISYVSDTSSIINESSNTEGKYSQIYTWCKDIVPSGPINVSGYANEVWYGSWGAGEFGINEWYFTMNFVNMNYSPRLYIYTDGGSGTHITFTYFDLAGRFGVSTAIFAKSRLNNMHDVAVYSLYTVK